MCRHACVCVLATSLFLICAFFLNQHASSGHAEHCRSQTLLFPVNGAAIAARAGSSAALPSYTG